MRRPAWALLLLIVLLGGAATPGAAQQDGTLYAVADADAARFTVFLRVHPLDDQVFVPTPYTDVQVRDANGTELSWADLGDGTLALEAEAAAPVTVTVRGVPGPVEQALRIPRLVEHTVLALPSDHEADPLARVDRASLDERIGTWPAPAGYAYWAGDVVDAQTIRFTRADEAAGPLPLALVSVLLVLLALTTVWLMVRVHRSTDDPTKQKQMPMLAHLEELRNRLLWVIGTVLVGSVLFFTFGFRWTTIAGQRIPLPFPTIYDNAAAAVFAWMSARVVPDTVTVVVTSPWDAVLAQLGIAFALAVLVAFPVLFYHLYAFIAPALYPKERRAVFVTVPVIVVLFVIGAAFGLGLMLPFMVRILYGFAGTLDAVALLNVADLIAMGALMGVVFGLAFELPIVMALLSGIGVVPAKTWRTYWRHAVVVIAIVAALVTDPTVVTQLIVGAVLLVLYGIGLLLAMVFERRRLTQPA